MRQKTLQMSVVLAMTMATAATSTELSLSEAMARGRQQAHEVSAARARLRASEERVEQAVARRWPSLSAQEVWMRTDSPADVFALLLQQGRFSFEDFVVSDPNNPDPLDNALTRFELTLPIYTGGELSARIRQARLSADATGVRAEWVGNLAALAAAEAYIGLAQARESVALLEQSLQTVDRQVQLTAAYVEQGMLVRSDLLRAEVERSRIEDLLAEARGMAKVAQASLSFRLAADGATTWQLEPLGQPQELSGNVDGWLAGAADRGDLQAARIMLQTGEPEVKARRAGFLPKVGVAARYDLNDESLFGSSGQSATVMAMASIDLFNGG